ncbi:MAG: ABC transporter substrate-binding protein [Fimbriimonadales bacterium]
MTTATPGSSYRQWVDAQISRFKARFPGSDVRVTNLSSNNDQLNATVQAAFAANTAPDVMMLYSGTQTTQFATKLLPLAPYIAATPGFYDSLTEWSAACVNYDCGGGTSPNVVAVPADSYGYYNFYNKDLFAKAGIAAPPTTYEEAYADCAKFTQIGVYGFIWGDRDGYATTTALDEDIASYLKPDEWKGAITGTLKANDPRIVAAVEALRKFAQIGCVQPDYATREQLDSANDFLNGKGAMFLGQPQFLPYWSAIESKIDVAPWPSSGPYSGQITADAGESWMIPKQAQHKDLAWQLIQLFTDATAEQTMPTFLGSPPNNKVAQATVQDPIVKKMAQFGNEATMPLYDNIIPAAVATVLWRELNLAFSGKSTASQALQVVQQTWDATAP